MSYYTMSSGQSNPSPLAAMELNPNFYTQFALAHNFMPDLLKSLLVLVKIILEWCLTFGSLPLEIVHRRRWGCRAISLLQLCYMVWLMPWALFAKVGGIPLALFLVVAGCLTIYHFVEARVWEWRGRKWRYTYSWGEALPFYGWLQRELSALLPPERRWIPRWLLSEQLIFRFWEPGVSFLAGMVLSVGGICLALLSRQWIGYHSPIPLGLLLLFGSTSLLFKRHIIHMRCVEGMRNQRDAAALAEIMADVHTEASEQSLQPALVACLAVPLPPIPEAETTAPGVAASEGPFFRFHCGRCGRAGRVKGTPGRPGRCNCGKSFVIPAVV